MFINDKLAIVYDIEVFPNILTCTLKNTESKEILTLEISERKNDILRICNIFLSKNCLFCGYNNIHFDNPIISFIIKNYHKLIKKQVHEICLDIYTLANTIINTENFESWKTYKYANLFETLDLLTMLYSSKLRVGLKEMQVTMKFHNVQEYNGDFTKPLPLEEIDKMILYNINDVESTTELLYKCESQIRLREEIYKEFNVNVLSKDGMSIGLEILKTKYLQATNLTWDDIKDLRSPCDTMNLNDIIFPFINFKHPELQKMLSIMKQQNVGAGRKAFEYMFLLENLQVSVGVGGIHSINKPELIQPNEDERLLDSDVALIQWRK